MARPISYTDQIAVKVLTRIVEGESLRSICQDHDMPGISTWYEWLIKIEGLTDRYAHARQDQADTLADEITYIADTETDYNRARVRIDARKWIAAKLKPKKYGDRIDVDASGDIGIEIVHFAGTQDKLAGPDKKAAIEGKSAKKPHYIEMVGNDK